MPEQNTPPDADRNRSNDEERPSNQVARRQSVSREESQRTIEKFLEGFNITYRAS